MTISTDRIRQYATDEFMFAADDVRAMAAELLAVREAKSVVPEMTIEKAVDIVWNDPGIDIDAPGAVYLAGWSACRAAMLAAAPTPTK
ncbi:hypothetical protein [Serratia fonticola]|uniref:hypothetical protein n=1 Tax=Serratia fonticola TaxID=47917 RepID=UPI0021AD8F8E|nr:hypothetical protein [Serratia fonticola]